MKEHKRLINIVEDLIEEEVGYDAIVELVTYYIVFKENGAEGENPFLENFLRINLKHLPEYLYDVGMSPKEIHFRIKKFKYLRWIDSNLYLLIPEKFVEAMMTAFRNV